MQVLKHYEMLIFGLARLRGFHYPLGHRLDKYLGNQFVVNQFALKLLA
jgi:hypothetical protein